MKCEACHDSYWVCENHADRPWEGEDACDCGGAGMPCPKCNPGDENNPPKPPAGSSVVFDKDGWRH